MIFPTNRSNQKSERCITPFLVQHSSGAIIRNNALLDKWTRQKQQEYDKI